jgi:hypothetical protein
VKLEIKEDPQASFPKDLQNRWPDSGEELASHLEAGDGRDQDFREPFGIVERWDIQSHDESIS